MNKKILSKMIFGASLLLLAACTNDEPMDDNTLPEGAYPLQIASVSMSVESSERPWGADAPQTRVTENTTDGNSSVWTNNDQIGVQIGSDQTNTGKYKVRVDENGNVTGLEAETALYWKNTSSQKVKGWYPADTGSDIPLNAQGSALAYVLYAETTSTVNYQATNIQLPFNHQLAKIRVVLEGSEKGDVTDVKVYTHPACKFTPNGTTKIAGSGNPEYIPMKKTTYDNGTTYCWEANVVPGNTIEQFQVNGVEGTLTKSVNPEKGKCHEITIEVNHKPTEITGGETITQPGNYIIKGDFTETVTLKGDGITLTLDGVNGNMNIPIKIEQGTPTIILQGNNALTALGAPAIWLIGKNTNVIIKGTENSHLKVSSTDGSAAIGTNYYSTATSEWTPPCGNITIENASIEASSSDAAAAIGTGVGFQGPGTCGVITIIKSDIKATSVQYLQRGKPAVIGTGGTDGKPMSCAGINITLKDGQNKDKFLNNLTGPYTKVGAGEGLNNASNTCSYVRWYNADGTEIK